MLADHAVVFSVLPLAPGRTALRTTWLVHPDAVEGVDYDLTTLAKVWNATNAEDSAFVARTQLGVQDPGYEPGPYSKVEGDVDAFVTWYVARMSGYLAGKASNR
jgi:glycine betaine catabolism A